jgi:hypothetical protein
MDSRIVYTAQPEELWMGFASAAERHRGVVHGAPPELAIEINGARLYVSEGTPTGATPVGARKLGADVREFVIDVHNPTVAERFIADAIEGIAAVVDDDDGQVTDGGAFVAAVRGRE